MRFENVRQKHISLQLRLSTMDSLTDGLVMDAISAAISLLWCSEVDSILSRNTKQVFHRMASQSAPSGISCSESGCIDVSIVSKTLSFGVVLLQLI